MIPAPIKTYSKVSNQTTSSDSNLSFKLSNDESEKENKGRKTRQAKSKAVRKIKQKGPFEDSFDGNLAEPTSKTEDPFDKLLSSPLKQEVTFKPLGFWTQKVKDLDEKKPEKKKENLYDLSDSDESYTATRKKKVRKKPAARKKKLGNPYDYTKYYKELKNKGNESCQAKTVKPNEGAILKERWVLNKEKQKLKDKEDKFTFDKASKLIGITSTPAKTKTVINLVGASNFGHASPIDPAATPVFKSPDFDVSCIRPEGSLKPENSAASLIKSPDFDVSHIRPNESLKPENSATPVLRGKRRKTKMVSEEVDETLKKEVEFSSEFLGFESKDLVKSRFFFSSDARSDIDDEKKEGSISDSSFRSACSHFSDSLIKSNDWHKKGDLLLQLRFACNLNFRKFFNVKNFYWTKLNFKSTENIPGDFDREADFYYSDNDGIERFNEDKLVLKSDIKAEEIKEIAAAPEAAAASEAAAPEAAAAAALEAPEEEEKEEEEEEEVEEGSFAKNVTMRRRYKNYSRMDETDGKSDESAARIDSDESYGRNTSSEESKLYDTAIDKLQNLTLLESSQYPKIVLEQTLTPNLSDKTGNDSSDTLSSSPEMDKTVKNLKMDERTPRRSPKKSIPETPESSPIPILESTCNDLKIGGVRASDWNLSRISEFPPVLESTRLEEPCQNVTINLKPGKKWMRSLSVIHQLQNRTLMEANDGSSLKGRNYSTFVKEVVEMQPPAFHESIIKNTDQVNTTDQPRMTDLVSQFSNMSLSRKSLIIKPINDERLSLFKTMLDLVQEQEEDDKDGNVTKVASVEDEYDCSVMSSKEDEHEHDSSVAEATLVEDVTIKEISSEVLTARDVVLARCNQKEPLPFSEHFNEKTLKNCKKIGEGVYGEVFMYNSDTVIKIIPIEGSLIINGDRQKKFDEVLSEIVIAMELSNLRYGKDNRTTGFNELKRCWCVYGEYPDYLIELWEDFDQAGTGSENDHPGVFQSDQLYIVLELAHGGRDLEAFVFNSAEQTYSVFLQTALSLAVAEKALEFEHRDLHWGNLLINSTDETFATFVIHGAEFTVPTNGVKVSIIDFTLSRMTYQGCHIFNDLSIDPSLFTSEGDYQFEIYRLMQNEVMNDWSLSKPKTNIFWLHYIVDKMITMVRYKRKTTKIHKNNIKVLTDFKDAILEYNSSTDFILEKLAN